MSEPTYRDLFDKYGSEAAMVDAYLDHRMTDEEETSVRLRMGTAFNTAVLRAVCDRLTASKADA